MKDIIFRAKRLDNGKWVQGRSILTLITDDSEEMKFYMPQATEMFSAEGDEATSNLYSINGAFYKVDPETVGQFTGFIDKNGKQIFEGDYWIETDDNEIFVVAFRNGEYCFVIYGNCGVLMPYGYDEDAGGFGECDCVPMTDYYIDKIEIIGNIHDNPELLDGGAADE